MIAGIQNYSTWNGDILVDDWKSTYLTEIFYGVISTIVFGLSEFVPSLKMLGMIDGMSLFLMEPVMIYLNYHSNSDAPATGSSTNIAYAIHILNLLIGVSFMVIGSMSKHADNSQDMPPPPPQSGLNNSTDSSSN